MLVDTGNRTQYASRELRSAHLHAEDCYRDTVVNRDMLRDVERKRRLSHGGTARDDDQLARLKAGRHFVEIFIPRRNTDDIGFGFLVVQKIDAFNDTRQYGLDAFKPLPGARARLGDLEDLRLGLVEQLADLLAGGAKRAFRDLGRDLRQAPLHGALAHQLGIAPDVERAGGVLGERREVG